MLEDIEKTNKSLSKFSKVCKYMSIVLKFIFVVFCLCWLFAAGLMLFSIFNPNEFSVVDDANITKLILNVFYGIIIAVMFIIFISMFSDAANGETPFTLGQVKRLRLISLMLVAYALLDFVIAYNSALMQINTFNSGYVSTNGSAVLPLDFAPMIAAAVVFAFSFVFKYGVLLQEFSDETL